MKRKQIIQWGIIGLFILIIPSSLIVNNHLSNSNPIDFVTLNNNEDKKTVLDTVKSTEYTPDFTGKGEDCDIALEQSLVDTSSITISNTSDPLNNTFYEPCPTAQSFPSSFVNMTIEDIYAPNKTLIIENDTINNWHPADQVFGSFKVQGNGYLENISVFMRHTGAGTDRLIDFYMCLSENDVGKIRPIETSLTLIASGLNVSSIKWYNITNIHHKLNVSETYNNTFFLYSVLSSGTGGISWGINYDIDGDGVDDSIVLDSSENLITYLLLATNTVDLNLKIGLAPLTQVSIKTLVVQNNPFDSGYDCSLERFTSFKLNTDSYLINASLNVRQQNSPTGNIYLVNSTWNSSSGRNQPNPDSAILLATIAPIANGWLDVDFTDIFLDNLKTDNNTWFIRVWETSSATTLEWRFTDDTDTNNNSLAYTYSAGWILEPVDYCLTLGLKIVTIEPEYINLKINNTAVIKIQDSYGTGDWSSIEAYTSSSGHLGFTISADWWDVACTITVVQINYTKTDITANANFSIEGSSQEVVWNVTDNEGLNYLDTRIKESATINFTIPASWQSINVFNGTINKTDEISIKSLNNGYSEICVLDASSGYWFLTASSVNLLETIETYVASNPVNIITYSDIVTFNATFKEKITQNDGIIKLSVFNPLAISSRLNCTLTKSTFDSDMEFSLGDWDVSDNITEYGEFRVQLSWNNDTAAAFRETGLTIIGETKLTLIVPAPDHTYYSNETFNIIVYYEDSNHLKAIDDSTLFYNIDAQGWRSTTANNGSIGYYTVPIDCSSFTTNGTKKVDITATKDYYLNQTLQYDFNIIVIEEDGHPTQTPPPDITPFVILGLGTVAVLGVVGFIKREALSKGLSAMVQKMRPSKDDQ